MEEIAELLRETREEAGIDLSEVSKDVNISEIILENIEAGKIGSFKDIFLLKEYIFSYAKYLGLNADEIIKNFNEYVFEYTSKIPVKEIEKTIELATKSADNVEIVSPYTTGHTKNNKKLYIFLYLLILLLVFIAIFWSVNQFSNLKINTYVINYRK